MQEADLSCCSYLRRVQTPWLNWYAVDARCQRLTVLLGASSL